MEFTGERVVPGLVDADLWQEHVSRYVFARTFAAGARVLDAGCGSGYGAALLAAGAREVLAIDVAAEAIDHSRANYTAKNLRFVIGDCCAVDAPDASFGLVVAFEVIEHLPDAAKFLAEAKRLLRPDGTLLVSTPNRRYYTEERGFSNPFHTREYDRPEFESLLQAFFAHCVLLEQNHAPAVTFTAAGVAASVEAAPQTTSDEPYFFLAICSQSPVQTRGLVYLPESGNVLRQRELHIHKLEDDLARFQQETSRQLEERREWAAQLEARIAKRDAQILERQEAVEKAERELEERTKWVGTLEERIAEKDAQIIERQQGVEKAERELAERTAWAAQLEARIAERDALIVERQQAIEKLEEELRERAAWARKLDEEIGASRARLEELGKELEERNVWAGNLNREIASLGERLATTTSALEASEEKGKSLHASLLAANADLSLMLGSRWYRIGRRLRVTPIPEVDRSRTS